ncbi:MAG: TraR/DksA C4-type zinc finger protein [Mobilicoccus sp.]|nr:TraR/DksA C4-type zinc finger protein [Mobilicoccus sp.]
MDDPAALLADLRRHRAAVAERVQEFELLARGLAEARSDADTDDEHDPEGSTVSWDRAVTAATAQGAREHLAQIDAAIARVESGWDGSCAGCGEQIPAERLTVRPHTDCCVSCADLRT